MSSSVILCDHSLLKKALPARPRRSNKGTYGRIALMVGSKGMAGAGYLASSAALRTGVGLCEIVTPEANRAIYQVTLPEAMVTSVDELTAETIAQRMIAADGAVVGCGMGTSNGALARLTALLKAWPDGKPLVLDADALNLLAAHDDLWQTPALAGPHKRVVITPHPGEMARLCGVAVTEVTADITESAQRYAATHGVTVVLKDAHTVIAAPDGATYVNTAGNAGMATGGCGDVLAGIIGSLLVQNRARPDESLTVARIAAAGVYLHATAGDAAKEAVGEHALCATDIVAHLADVTKDI